MLDVRGRQGQVIFQGDCTDQRIGELEAWLWKSGAGLPNPADMRRHIADILSVAPDAKRGPGLKFRLLLRRLFRLDDYSKCLIGLRVQLLCPLVGQFARFNVFEYDRGHGSLVTNPLTDC